MSFWIKQFQRFGCRVPHFRQRVKHGLAKWLTKYFPGVRHVGQFTYLLGGLDSHLRILVLQLKRRSLQNALDLLQQILGFFVFLFRLFPIRFDFLP